MSESSESDFYEEQFAKSDKTDAILVVDGKKLHVNKALLSFHSDYFNTLFNGEFKEKSMPEIEIKDVDFENFATVLSLIHPNPLMPDEEDIEKLLEITDRFVLPNAKRHLELFICSTDMDHSEKLKLGDKFDSDVLRYHALEFYQTMDDYKDMHEQCDHFSDKTKALIFDDFFGRFKNNLQE